MKHLHKSRGHNDECSTPEWIVRAILPYISKDKTVWCPFDTEKSWYVRLLREQGNSVIASHIADGQNFFLSEPPTFDVLVSNPPFTNKAEIVKRIIQFGKPFALLLPIEWLSDARPIQLFAPIGLELLIPEQRAEFGQTVGKANGKVSFKTVYYCHDVLPERLVLLPKEREAGLF